MEFDDLLYYIIGIIAIIISLISRKKKEANTKEVVPPAVNFDNLIAMDNPEQPHIVFEQVSSLDDLKPKDEMTNDKHKEKTNKPTERTFWEKETDEHFLHRNNEIKHSKKKPHISSTHEEYIKPETEDSDDSEIDWQKAIIYSEILKRKHQ